MTETDGDEQEMHTLAPPPTMKDIRSRFFVRARPKPGGKTVYVTVWDPRILDPDCPAVPRFPYESVAWGDDVDVVVRDAVDTCPPDTALPLNDELVELDGEDDSDDVAEAHQ